MQNTYQQLWFISIHENVSVGRSTEKKNGCSKLVIYKDTTASDIIFHQKVIDINGYGIRNSDEEHECTWCRFICLC